MRLPGPAPTSTAYATFAANLDGARNVVEAGRNLERLGVTKVDIGDLYRGAWLQAVSALDTFMHAEILRRVEALAQSDGDRPAQLDRVRITVRDAEGMRLGTVNPAEVVVSAVSEELERRTIQRAAAITKSLGYVTDRDVWKPLADMLRDNGGRFAQLTAGGLQARLDAVVERRNQIAHGADLLPDGSGCKRAIEASDIDDAISWIKLVVLGLCIVLGDVPDLVPLVEHDSRSDAVNRRRNSVLLIQEQEAIADGAKVEFCPLPYIREPLSDWLDADPSRSRAVWCASGLPLQWAADEKRYSPTGLIKKMYVLAGLPVPATLPGPDYWHVPGTGSLYAIANRIHSGNN